MRTALRTLTRITFWGSAFLAIMIIPQALALQLGAPINY